MKSYQIIKHMDCEGSFSVAHNSSVTSKKIKQQSLEVNLYHYKKNSGFSIVSTHHPEAMKTYYIVSGKCMHLESEKELTTGDLLVVGELEEFNNLYMLEDTHILVHGLNVDSYAMKGANASKLSEVLSRIQVKDSYTETHCSRVFMLVYKMVIKLGYKGNRIFNIARAARYHDVGKLFIQDDILTKPSQLTSTEYDIMKSHVLLGKELIAEDFSDAIFSIMSEHHERMDGSGYPKGLVGEEISEEGRILAICDSFDAMVTDRVYKRGKSIEEGLAELIELSGLKYDRRLVDVFVQIVNELQVDKEAYSLLK